MNAPELIRDYGYYAVVVGTFLEGELIMLAAGVAACAGILSLPGIILAGMAGIFASDTFCFLIGRWGGARLQRWFPRLHARLDPVFKLIQQHDDKLVIYFQFFPGLCTVTPIAYGMSAIRTSRFLLLDFVGNAGWTLVFSLGGYIFGTAFGRLVNTAHAWAPVAGVAVVLVALAFVGISRALGKRFAPVR